jgi:hypothetical protein
LSYGGVAPFAGAWIETLRFGISQFGVNRSRPSRAGGLKQIVLDVHNQNIV